MAFKLYLSREISAYPRFLGNDDYWLSVIFWNDCLISEISFLTYASSESDGFNDFLIGSIFLDDNVLTRFFRLSLISGSSEVGSRIVCYTLGVKKFTR